MKCSDCPEYEVCRKKYDLRKVRPRCKKSRTPKAFTNADKIRSMTDEELAQLLGRCEGEGYQDSSITPVDEYGYHMNMFVGLAQTASGGGLTWTTRNLWKISKNGTELFVRCAEMTY